MTIKVGDRLPDVQLSLATPEGPIPVKSSDFFAGKRVALFAVPGAYTPTCSAKHLPSYVEKAADLKGKGIDEIVATSVNDAFVLGAWNEAQGSGTHLIATAWRFRQGPAGNGRQQVGMGHAASVTDDRHDGVVEQVKVERRANSASSAENILGQ